MENYLEQLNDMQYEAATYIDGPLLILAGAGSGKTNTMTKRIAYMISSKGISPYNILAVTFTNKAAKEMKDRVEALVGTYPGMWIQTFHSACLRILRSHAERIGYSSSFVVYDPLDQKNVVKNIFKEQNIDEKDITISYVLNAISKAKEKELSADDYLESIKNSFATNKSLLTKVAAVYKEYEEILRKNNAMDFDDLILNTVRLFEENEDVLYHYQDLFKYIMVDEYQDTNMLQYKLVYALAKRNKNICVVGDDDQCIYEWRGADIRNILEFERDFPGTKIVKLEQNYRSTGYILDAAYSVISKNKGRKEKKLWTNLGEGEKPYYHRCVDDKEEARYIGSKIKELMKKDDSLKFSDFSILYRTNVQSRRFEEYFMGAGIPYQVLSGQKYYDRKEIKDIVSYLRLIVNPKDDISFERVINEPKRGVGDSSLAKIKAFAKLKGLSLLDAVLDDEIASSLPAKAKDSVSRFASLLSTLNGQKDEMSVNDIYDLVLTKSGYLDALKLQNSIEADSRIENLLEFKTVILEKEKDFTETKLTLDEFLESFALLSDIDNHDASKDCVVLMTLHSAKGLEFPVVFMPGMEMGLFPSYRVIENGQDVEEERRLCYVGITRARRYLFLTSAEERVIYGKYERCSESEFLKELDRKVLAGDSLYERKSKYSDEDRYNSQIDYKENSYVSPFLMANALRNNSNDNKKNNSLALNKGDRVNHQKFGDGTVITCEGNIVTVIFDDFGTKKLAKDIAPLKKI